MRPEPHVVHATAGRVGCRQTKTVARLWLVCNPHLRQAGHTQMTKKIHLLTVHHLKSRLLRRPVQQHFVTTTGLLGRAYDTRTQLHNPLGIVFDVHPHVSPGRKHHSHITTGMRNRQMQSRLRQPRTPARMISNRAGRWLHPVKQRAHGGKFPDTDRTAETRQCLRPTSLAVGQHSEKAVGSFFHPPYTHPKIRLRYRPEKWHVSWPGPAHLFCPPLL